MSVFRNKIQRDDIIVMQIQWRKKDKTKLREVTRGR